MSNSENHWSIGKCHRVIRPLHSALGRLRDLERTYPSLLEYPYPEKSKEDIAAFANYNTHNRQRPSRLASQKYTYSSRKPGLNSGVFGPVFASSFIPKASTTPSTATKSKTKHNKRKEDDRLKSPESVFEDYKLKASIEAYSCALAVFKAFRQFLLMVGDHPKVCSLIERSSFQVGRCIAMTQDTIPEGVWYENTDMFARYRKIITMGHGIELVLEHSNWIRQTLPAFILECVGNNNIELASLLAHKYMEILSIDEFWCNLRVLQNIAEVIQGSGSFTLATIISEVGYRFRVTNLYTIEFNSFLNNLRDIESDEVVCDSLKTTCLHCTQVILRGARRLDRKSEELKNSKALLLTLVRLLICPPIVPSTDTDEVVEGLLLHFTRFNNKRFSEITQCIKLYKNYRLQTGIRAMPQPAPLFLNSFVSIFSEFSIFKSILEYYLDSHPRFVRKTASHYVSTGGRGLAAVEWQDNLESTLLNASIKIPASHLVEQTLDSWVILGESNGTMDISEASDQNSEESEDEIVRYGHLARPAPETPKCDKINLNGKYSKILPDGILEWSLRRSCSKNKVIEAAENSPLMSRDKWKQRRLRRKNLSYCEDEESPTAMAKDLISEYPESSPLNPGRLCRPDNTSIFKPPNEREQQIAMPESSPLKAKNWSSQLRKPNYERKNSSSDRERQQSDILLESSPLKRNVRHQRLLRRISAREKLQQEVKDSPDLGQREISSVADIIQIPSSPDSHGRFDIDSQPPSLYQSQDDGYDVQEEEGAECSTDGFYQSDAGYTTDEEEEAYSTEGYEDEEKTFQPRRKKRSRGLQDVPDRRCKRYEYMSDDDLLLVQVQGSEPTTTAMSMPASPGFHRKKRPRFNNKNSNDKTTTTCSTKSGAIVSLSRRPRTSLYNLRSLSASASTTITTMSRTTITTDTTPPSSPLQENKHKLRHGVKNHRNTQIRNNNRLSYTVLSSDDTEDNNYDTEEMSMTKGHGKSPGTTIAATIAATPVTGRYYFETEDEDDISLII